MILQYAPLTAITSTLRSVIRKCTNGSTFGRCAGEYYSSKWQQMKDQIYPRNENVKTPNHNMLSFIPNHKLFICMNVISVQDDVGTSTTLYVHLLKQSNDKNQV